MKLLSRLVKGARAVSGGSFLWLTMTAIFVVNIAVMIQTPWDRDFVDYILAALNPILLIASGFISGVKLHERAKERRGTEKPHA